MAQRLRYPQTDFPGQLSLGHKLGAHELKLRFSSLREPTPFTMSPPLPVSQVPANRSVSLAKKPEEDGDNPDAPSPAAEKTGQQLTFSRKEM